MTNSRRIKNYSYIFSDDDQGKLCIPLENFKTIRNDSLKEIDSLRFYRKSDLNKSISSISWGIFDLLYRYGRFHAKPMFSLANRFQRLRYKKSPYKVVMLVYRIRMVFLAFISIPLAFWTAPGAVFQALGKTFSENFAFSPRSFSSSPSYSPKVDSKESMPHLKELVVMQWNVCMGPGFMSLDNRVEIPTKRVDGVMDQIRQINPSILTLQEVFDAETTEELVKKLNEAGYDCIHSVLSTNPLSISSGILLAVKRESDFLLEIEDIKVWKFSNLKGPDANANKGLLRVRVNLFSADRQKKQILNIFTTHLQASYDDVGHGDVRLEQVKSIVAKINDLKGNDKQGVIFSGDFNFAKEPLEKTDSEDEYSQQIALLRSAKMFNPNFLAQCGDKGSFMDLKGKHEARRVKSVVDYIFINQFLEKANRGAEIVEIDTKHPLSDHFPVIQRLSVDSLFM